MRITLSTVVDIAAQIMGRQFKMTNRVAELEQDKCLTIENQSGPLKYEITYKLTPVDYLTHLKCECTVQSTHPIFDIAAPLAESLARERIQGDLASLKQLAEKTAAERV